MIAPASPADWLQGTTMMTLLAGVALVFSRMLGPDEPTFDHEGIWMRSATQSSWAPSTRRSCVEGTK